MLFDLRSRGRRRVVQVVYLGLAVLMGGGLILFGVGAGNGFGGLLNGFTNNGSSGAQKQVVSQQEKAALVATKANPSDAAAWGQLLQARWITAGEGSNLTASGTFTTAGKQELAKATDAWQHYIALTKTPDQNLAILAARAYAGENNWSGAAGAWEAATLAAPSEAKGYDCLALSAYAAGQTRKGKLASAKALSLVSKTQAASLKPAFTAAKGSASTAQQAVQAEC